MGNFFTFLFRTVTKHEHTEAPAQKQVFSW